MNIELINAELVERNVRLIRENERLRSNLDALDAAHRELQQALREIVLSFCNGAVGEDGTRPAFWFAIGDSETAH